MGGLDTQGLLPFGEEAQVRRHAAGLLELFSGGGYILAASHTIPPETPEANLFALYAEAGLSREQIFDRAADLRRRSTAR
jgi:uroporphyrinogen decarboxylase